MATVICRNFNGKLSILGVVAFRRDSDNKPTSSNVTLGWIDPKNHKPVYNDNFLPFVTSHGLDPATALKSFVERTGKNFMIDFSDPITVNNELNNVNNNVSTDLSSKNDDIHSNNIDIITKIKLSKKCIFAPIYLLNFLITSFGIGDILHAIFLDLTDKIKALVYYNILKHDQFLYCKSFVEQYDIPFSPSELSSQRISEIIRNITSKDRLLFYHLWSEKVNDNDYLALDTTSISSYSNLLSKTAFGHNKQKGNLKQINLCYLFGERSGLPVYTTSYNGSLHDVSTLITTLKQTSFLQNRHLKLVLDRGVYSKKNINYMVFSEYKSDFIIGLPATTTIYNDLIEEHSYIYENISNAFQYNGNTIFAATKKIKLYDNIYLYAHIFCDPSKIDANRDIIVEEITTMYNNAMSDPLSYINDPDYRYALTFRKSSKQPNGYVIKKNNDSYKEFRTRDGWFILISNCEKDPQQALKIYRNKDVVEKAFDLIKHFLRKKRTYVHNDESYENTIFITFICMILISIIHNVMTENNLYKNRTMDEFLLELSSHKAVIMDDKYIIDPLTKTLKNYFDLFNCPYPDE